MYQLTKTILTIVIGFEWTNDQRKDCKQVLRYKKDLRNFNMNNLDLSEGTKLFINESLCPYYKGLWVLMFMSPKDSGTGSEYSLFLLLILS